MYLLELINSELFPKMEYKEHPVIQFTEAFSKNYFANCITKKQIPAFKLIDFRRMVFGYAASSYSVAEIKGSLDSIYSIEKLYSKENISALKLEWYNQQKAFKDNNEFKGFTLESWTNFLSNEFFQYTTDSLIKLETKTKAKIRIEDSVEVRPSIKPSEIKNKLDRFYVGSESVKETLSRIFYEQLLRIENKINLPLPKRNLLLVGPSGSGKTYIIKKICEILNLPIIIFDASKLTARGYVGDKVEDVLRMLYLKAKSLEKMQKGVIFFDEIDKLAQDPKGELLDVSKTGPQQDLLKFIEGDDYEFNSTGEKYDKKDLKFNTSGLLIIAGGAFEGIEQVVKKRLKGGSMGFGKNASARNFNTTNIQVDDLINYGFIKEFAARFQIISILPQKTVEDLYKILVEVDDSIIRSYEYYFRIHGCELLFTEQALRMIAQYAFDQNIGARGIVQILENILPMYELGDMKISRVIVDESYILGKLAIV